MGPKKQGRRTAEASLHQVKKRVLPESLDESSIERASILDGEPHSSYCYPLHSTALEEDLIVPEEREEEVSRPAEKVEKKVGGRAGGPGRAAPSAGAKQTPAASPRTQEGPVPGDKRGRKRKSVGEKEAAGRGGKPARKLAGGITEEERRKGPGLGRRPGPYPTRGSRPPPQAPAPREASRRVTPPDRQTTAKRVSQQLQFQFVARTGKEAGAEEEKKKEGKSANRKSSSSGTPTPGPKRARTRKSSSGQSADRQQQLARMSSSPGGGAEPTVSQTVTGARSRAPGGADASVVLDTFLSLCQTYKESVESTAVRRAIDSFSSSLEEDLTERITASKELRVLKGDNAKVGSQIKAKTQKLLDAKYERFGAEQQLSRLRKEKAELKQRLAHLRRGVSFLQGLGDLTTRYLAHRRAHPAEKEQFGSSSLPALLLETKSLLRAEDYASEKPTTGRDERMKQ